MDAKRRLSPPYRTLNRTAPAISGAGHSFKRVNAGKGTEAAPIRSARPVSSNFSEYPRVYTIKFTYRLAALPYKVPMRTIRNFLANETRATANEYGLGADEAKSEISAAGMHLVEGRSHRAAGGIVCGIVEVGHN